MDSESKKLNIILEDSKHCTPCKTKDKKVESQYYCTDCEAYYCEDCFELHLRVPYLAKHIVLKHDDIDIWSKLQYKCTTHNKNLEFFCGEHKTLCCHVCVSLKHSACVGMQYILESAKNICAKNDIETMIEQTDKEFDRIQSYEKKLQAKAEANLRSKSVYSEKLEEYTGGLKQTIDLLQKKALEEMNRVFEVNKKYSEQMSDELETFSKELHDLKRQLTTATAEKEVLIFISLKRGEKAIADMTKRMSNMDISTYKENFWPVFVDDVHAYIGHFKKIVSLEDEETKQLSACSEEYFGTKKINTQGRNLHVKDTDIRKCKVLLTESYGDTEAYESGGFEGGNYQKIPNEKSYRYTDKEKCESGGFEGGNYQKVPNEKSYRYTDTEKCESRGFEGGNHQKVPNEKSYRYTDKEKGESGGFEGGNYQKVPNEKSYRYTDKEKGESGGFEGGNYQKVPNEKSDRYTDTDKCESRGFEGGNCQKVPNEKSYTYADTEACESRGFKGGNCQKVPNKKSYRYTDKEKFESRGFEGGNCQNVPNEKSYRYTDKEKCESGGFEGGNCQKVPNEKSYRYTDEEKCESRGIDKACYQKVPNEKSYIYRYADKDTCESRGFVKACYQKVSNEKSYGFADTTACDSGESKRAYNQNRKKSKKNKQRSVLTKSDF